MRKLFKSSLHKFFVSLFLIFYTFTPQVLAIDELIDTIREDSALLIQEEPIIEETLVEEPSVPLEPELLEGPKEVVGEKVVDKKIKIPEKENPIKKVWENEGFFSTTVEPIILNKKYVAPQNASVTVTFTKLPNNPGYLSIEEVTLTDREILETNSLSKIAYDITTEMEDGTFEYDLTLPDYEDGVRVFYSENRDLLLYTLQKVDNPIVNENGNIKIEDLNHFSIYIYTLNIEETSEGLRNQNGGQSECGNSVLEQGEQCDDGNAVDNDFCSNTCKINHIKIDIYHATPPETATNGWNFINVDDDSIIKTNGHDDHAADIIPAFDYYGGSYPGKNLTTLFPGITGQEILDNGCRIPETTGSITMCKYNDLNKNGVIDDNEPKIWWEMTIIDQDGDDAGETWYTATPDDDCLTFNDMDFGEYVVTEAQVSGWSRSFPLEGDSQTVTLNINNPDVTVDFLNYEASPVCGNGIVEGEEECDGIDGVIDGENFCTYDCKLVPIYDGSHSCPDGTEAVYVDTHTVSGTDNDGILINVTSGKTYLFEATGTFIPTGAAGYLSDAGYTLLNDVLASQYGIQGTPPDYGAHALLGDFGSGVGIIDWGDYNPDHIYTKQWTPNVSQLQFLIGDRYSNWFGTPYDNQSGIDDNSGELTLNVYECKQPPVTIKGYKVVCDAEQYLPNAGDGGLTINENTAQNWVDQSSGHCRLETNWDFQWAPAGNGATGSFQTDTYSYQLPWTTFTPTSDAVIYDIASLGGRIETREVFPSSDYVPFTNDSNNNVSAEFYCTGDAANYDNWEWLNSPQSGQTYYCVGFNALKTGSIVGTKYEDLDGDGDRAYEGGSEPGLPGWTINLIDSSGAVIDTMDTDEKGDYWFNDVLIGDYKVCEVLKDGWVNTEPGAGEVCTDITLEFGENEHIDFGNIRNPLRISAQKIVCDYEKDLPDWGNHGGMIDADTAQNWVNSHPDCRLEEQWQFQWAPDNSGSLGAFQTDTSLLEGPWTTFTPGNDALVYDLSNVGSKLEVREVFPESNFLGFSNTFNNTVTAEIYCSGDVYNYDNWEWLNNPKYGETYHCVAWNVRNDASIQGRKYYDVNINGTFDQDEKNNINRLDGWRIKLYNEQRELVDSMLTGDDTTPAGNVGKGQYRFENLLAGTYYVCEMPKDGWYQTEPSSGVQHPVNGLYCHTVNLRPTENRDGIQFGNYQGSDVEICKVDNYERPLSGWDLVLASEQVDGPTKINVGDGSGTNSSDLPAGTYLIRVSGTYKYGNSLMIADAGFSYRPNNIPYGSDDWVSGLDLPSKGLMAWVNGSPVNWGAYNDVHQYTYVYNHISGPINISIYDDYYGDNVNDDFEFEIYKVNDWAQGITEENGCITLEAIPYGEYILDEYLPEGWININGKGINVTIDELKENFTIKNRIAAPVTIVATKIVCENEEDLPNWGAIKSDGNPITQARINQFLADSEGRCELVPDWEFEWGYQGSGNPGDDLVGYGGVNWNTFGVTDGNGVAVVKIDQLEGGRLEFREVLQENYIPFTYGDSGNNSNNETAEFYCHNDVMNYDNWEWLNTPEYGETYYCVGFNTLIRTDIHGYKWQDLDRDGEFDEELEPLLSGWKIFIDENEDSEWNEGEEYMETDGGENHFGWYWFEDLVPGEYRICEEIPEGWAQNYPGVPTEPQCHTITLPNCNTLETRAISANAVETYCEFNFGNIEESQLYVSETNDSWPNTLGIGDTFTYTITVRANKGPVTNVTLINLPPEGFIPQLGTFSAVSSVRGTLDTSGVLYASPGQWDLGDLEEGEEITITYQALVTGDVETGTYPDLTYAYGTGVTGSTVIALSEGSGFEVNDGIVDENFVGTQVKVEEETELEEGEVLGATTEVTLPSTGANTYLTLGALISMLIGFLLLLVNPKKKIQMLIIASTLLLGTTTFLRPTPTYAVESTKINVQIVQPKTPTNKTSFNIGFVALDILSRPLTIKCYENTFGEFGTYSANSGNCVVNDSIITESGTYKFYVIATAGTDTKTSSTVTVVVDLDMPTPITSYTKTPAPCSYILTFTTGDESKVQIFRSTVQPFSANASTLINELPVTPNQNVTYTDTVPICDQEYFYAIRTIDTVGNPSVIVTDNIVNTIQAPATTLTTATTTTVTPGTPLAVTENGDIAGEDISEDAEVKGEEEITEDIEKVEEIQNEEEQDTKDQQEEKSNIGLIVIVATLLVGGIGYVYVKNRKTTY